MSPRKVEKLVVEKARELGFCFGVRNAIKLLLKAATTHKNIATLGPIVHNRQVVNKLAELGINVVTDLNQVKGDTITISSHGLAPETLAEIHNRKLNVIDTTCPNVRSAQKAARRLADNGFNVIIFGEAAHPEVKGLIGWAGKNTIATLNAKDLAKLNFMPRLGILSQTTQSQVQFEHFIKKILAATFSTTQEIRILNTLCRETRKRQEAALELANNSDLIIVVGGLNSANTRHLAELCTPLVETHLIEDASAIDSSWLTGKTRIGVTAGASTPDEAITEVIARLQSR
jgi:4-hydroxy-3-methylbut-2-enyl diphosphate reductase